MACIRHRRRGASSELAYARGLRQAVLAVLLALLGSASAVAEPDNAALIEAARNEGRLVVATSAPAEGFRRFLAGFTKKYPFIDAAAELRSSPAATIMAEVQRQIAAKAIATDVMHTANLADFLTMARQQQLLRYDSPEYQKFPRTAQDPGYWAPARVIGIIMAYNKKRLRPAKAPRAWTDLLLPEFAGGKFAIKNADAGTLFNQLYLLDQQLGADFLERLAGQKPRILPAEKIIDALADGSIEVGATVDHWRVYEPGAVEAGIAPVYPQDGMPLVLAPIAIVAGAPHPNAAKLFIDFALSKEGQQLLNSEIFGVYSMRPDVLPSLDQPPMAEVRPILPANLDDYIRARERFEDRFKSLFR